MHAALPPRCDSLSIRGGSIPGSGGQPAYELLRREPVPLPVLIAVPHAGRSYPPDLVSRMRHPGESSLRLEDRLVDLVAGAVARETGAALLVAHAPRAMIDLNRAPEDMDWSMVTEKGGREAWAGERRAQMGRRARSGLGLVPRRLPGMGELWTGRLSAAELSARIGGIHRPYHQQLAQMLEVLRDRWGAALLLDLHSMPPLGPKTGAEPAPDFVVGDRFGASCAPSLSAITLEHLEQSGRLAVHNRPYAGGYVLERHSAPARAIHALQVELCRATYLDQGLREPGAGLAEIVIVMAGLVRRLAEALVETRGMAQAAE